MTTAKFEPAIQVDKKKSKMAGTGTMQMDPLFLALSFHRRRKFEECAEVCTQLLKKNPYDQVFQSWEIMLILTAYLCFSFSHEDKLKNN